jgi:hypothetical protein
MDFKISKEKKISSIFSMSFGIFVSFQKNNGCFLLSKENEMVLVKILFEERMVKCMFKRRLSEQFTHRQRFKPYGITAYIQCFFFYESFN